MYMYANYGSDQINGCLSRSMTKDISCTLDSASHTTHAQAKIEARSQALVVPTELTQSMIIWVFCIAEMDKADNKSSSMQLKSI